MTEIKPFMEYELFKFNHKIMWCKKFLSPLYFQMLMFQKKNIVQIMKLTAQTK